jgi:predicted TIM-barrel fold metal-dependent hydrolase
MYLPNRGLINPCEFNEDNQMSSINVHQGQMIFDAHMNIGRFPYFDFTDNEEWDTYKSAEILINKMSSCGISKAVVCSFESMFYNYHKGNFDLGEIQKKHADKIIGLATVHPPVKSAMVDLENAVVNYKLKGLKLNPLYQRFNPLSSEVVDLMEFCESYRLPVMFHSGSLHKETSAETLGQLAGNFKEIPFIFAHMGGTNPYVTAEKVCMLDNVFLETSVSSHVFNPIKSIVGKVGAHRVLYGSDFPCGSPPLEIFRILDAGLNENEMELILYKNCENLFVK